jgi:UDP-N-acetylmuramyl pentapeptide phosphotransferase/UDP-N-acetylglucosamine-1-phosphate transferase
MNAFNFMDGINGIAAGCAVVACLFLGFIAASENANFVVISCLCLGAASLGFAIYNFPEGRIFMGDAGSQFIGFVLASLAVFGKSVDEARLSIYLVPVIFSPFIFDVVITLIYRALRGQNILKAHRDHLYQIAIKLGASHVQVSGAYFVLTGICGAVAIAVQAADPMGRLQLIAALFPVFGVLAALVYRAGLKAGVVEPLFTASRPA